VQVAAGLVRSCISRKEETGILATQADARTFMNFLPFFLVSLFSLFLVPYFMTLISSVADLDPGCSAFLKPGSGIQDGKNKQEQDLDPG